MEEKRPPTDQSMDTPTAEIAVPAAAMPAAAMLASAEPAAAELAAVEPAVVGQAEGLAERPPAEPPAAEPPAQAASAARARKAINYELLIALFIAGVSLLSTYIGYWASNFSDEAGSNDNAAMRAALAASETRALSFVEAYEDYGAYANYTRYLAMNSLIGRDVSRSEDSAKTRYLKQQQAETYNLAMANLALFPSRYIRPDGTFNITRELGELWAEEERERVLDPSDSIVEGEKNRDKGLRMGIAVLLFSIAPLFFTLREDLHPRYSNLVLIGGGLFVVVGLIVAVLVRWG